MTTLDNGLRVILRENHDAPVASFWIWYRVGGRNEIPGRTGLSHWVEHMQFKGTTALGKGRIFGNVSREGGTLNAFTSLDWTVYFETLPADRLDLSLAIESDRMRNSLFDPVETESERTVILSERQGAENRPTYLLMEEVYGTAFRAHPYRHLVIGYEDDLRAISRDDLHNHYRRFYLPNNAVITAAGDFDANELLAKIERAFGDIPRGDDPAPIVASEPPQLGERRVTLRRPSATDYLWMAYHIPAASHPDTAALLVLDAVLSGAKSFGMGGGGPMGRSSRLYRALVATGLASSAGSDSDMAVDPTLMLFGVTALPGADTVTIETTLDAEVERVRTEVVGEDEFARVLKQLEAQFVYSAAGVSSQAFWLGQMEMLGDAGRADTLIGELRSVTPEDVRRVARTWLDPERRTVGWLHPSEDGGGKDESVTVETMPTDGMTRRYRLAALRDGPPDVGASGAPSRARASTGTVERWPGRRPFERITRDSGITVLGQVRPDDPAVVAHLRLAAGSLADDRDRPGMAAFTGRMLSRGQAGRSFAAFNELTDGLGASLSVDTGRMFVDVSIRCLRDDFPAMLDLTVEVLRQPDFPEHELERVRNEMLASIRESEQSTGAVADLAMRQTLYPEGHPYRGRVIGEPEIIRTVTREDLVRFHAAHYGAATMTVAAVGGIDSTESLADLVHERFGGWSMGVSAPSLPEPVEPVPATRRVDRAVAGKSQTDILLAYPTLARDDPDYYALNTATVILGQLGLSGRLGAEVRDKRGLAYHVSAAVDAGRRDGLFLARAGVSPNDADRAIAAIIDEMGRIGQTDVDASELDDAQRYLTGVLPIALERSGGVASLLLAIDYYGLGLDYIERYPDVIRALTRDDLRRAIASHLDPDRLVIATAGPSLSDRSGKETA